MTHIENRRNVLRSFIARQGGFAAVVSKFKLSQSQASYLSQLTAKDSTASFGEKSAKNWESRLGLPADTLVHPSAEISTPSQTPNIEPPAASAAPTLAETLAQLGELLQRASPKTRAVVADLLGRYAQDPINGKSIAQAIELLINAEVGEKPGA